MYLSGNSTLSSLVLNLNTVSLHTMSSLKVFHLLIQHTGKLINLSVFSHLGLTFLNKCPLVQLSLNSHLEKVKSMNVCMRSSNLLD